MASTASIPLARGQLNTARLIVAVTSDGAWRLGAQAAATDASRGHMRLETSPTVVLSAPLQVLDSTGQRADLTAESPIVVRVGSGSVIVPVALDQAVSPADAPGTYSIVIVFSAISGF